MLTFEHKLIETKRMGKLNYNREIYNKYYKNKYESMSEFIYAYKHPDTYEKDRLCSKCGKVLHFKNKQCRFDEYCSPECMKTSEKWISHENKSKAQKINHNNPETKSKRLKTLLSPEVNEKFRNNLKKSWQKPGAKEKRMKWLYKAIKDPNSKWNSPEHWAKITKNFISKEELLLLNNLSKFTKIIHQYGIKGLRHPYDMYAIDYNTLIEYDGSYWHEKKDNSLRDKKVNKFAIQNGYNIIRIKDKLCYKYGYDKVAEALYKSNFNEIEFYKLLEVMNGNKIN